MLFLSLSFFLARMVRVCIIPFDVHAEQLEKKLILVTERENCRFQRGSKKWVNSKTQETGQCLKLLTG